MPRRVIAHLDPDRRIALFDELEKLGAQVWMTGADPAAFSGTEPLNSGYWYYCETSRGYYPYVKDCPSGWKAVPPAPAPAQ